MPYIIGIHSSAAHAILKSSSALEIVIVDLDQGKISCPNNDLELLPTTYLAELKATIHRYFTPKQEKLIFSSETSSSTISVSQYRFLFLFLYLLFVFLFYFNFNFSFNFNFN